MQIMATSFTRLTFGSPSELEWFALSSKQHRQVIYSNMDIEFLHSYGHLTKFIW